MIRLPQLTAVLLISALTACGTTASKNPSRQDPSVSKINLQDVPKAALAAAEHNVPGIYIHGASIIRHPAHDVYELKGLSHHTHYEIYVTEEGHILDVEHDRSLSD